MNPQLAKRLPSPSTGLPTETRTDAEFCCRALYPQGRDLASAPPGDVFLSWTLRMVTVHVQDSGDEIDSCFLGLKVSRGRNQGHHHIKQVTLTTQCGFLTSDCSWFQFDPLGSVKKAPFNPLESLIPGHEKGGGKFNNYAVAASHLNAWTDFFGFSSNK
eukprot:763396-Hanusia_phi.AAC.1